MNKWQYGFAMYYTKNERGEGLLAGYQTHQYVRSLDGKNEYKDENVILYLNYLGKEGWELVSSTPIIGSEGKGFAGLFAIDPGGIGSVNTQGVMLWFKKEVGKTKELPNPLNKIRLS